MEKSVERASRITHQLLGFVGKSESTVSEVNLNELAEETIRLITHETKNRDIEIIRDMEPSPGPIKSDPYQLRQVLLNLLTNAVHAIKSAGTITIAIKEAGDSRVITISDTGHGYPPGEPDKNIRTVFQHKAPGEGTGLGLFVTRGIIEKLGGTIEVESKVGSGTSFSVRLPKHLKKTDDVGEKDNQNWVEKIKSRFARADRRRNHHD